ncbi:MAG: dihydroorotase [Clostridia bacterium]
MIILKNGLILYGENDLVKRDILIDNGKIVAIEENIEEANATEFDINELWVIPGAIDVHAHLRDPGFSHKETVLTGSKSAAKGGITTIMPMPNLSPVPDSVENLQVELSALEKSIVHAFPYASVSIGEKGVEISDLKNLAPYVKAFTDDGIGVNNLNLLENAMDIARQTDKIIASHAEKAGYGTSPMAEYLAVETEIELLKHHPCKYHFCHMSTTESFDLIRKAKADGLDVTCEVTPHHLFLNNDGGISNGNFKMNPPLRSSVDMKATITALLDGTATMVATDHAPHTEQEKANFETAPNGIIGFETMLPLLYTKLVATDMITKKKLIELTSKNPAERFNLPYSQIEVGSVADIACLDIFNPHKYNKFEIQSKSSNSPFIGETLLGFNKLTLVNGKVVFCDCDID